MWTLLSNFAITLLILTSNKVLAMLWKISHEKSKIKSFGIFFRGYGMGPFWRKVLNPGFIWTLVCVDLVRATGWIFQLIFMGTNLAVFIAFLTIKTNKIIKITIAVCLQEGIFFPSSWSSALFWLFAVCRSVHFPAVKLHCADQFTNLCLVLLRVSGFRWHC